MSKFIKYTGPDDARTLGTDDLSRHAGVEKFEEVTFDKGVSVEVDDAVADALAAAPEVFGTFELVTKKDALAEQAANDQLI